MVFMKRGFTLLEVLLVVAIVAMLSTLGAVSVSAQRKKANDARRRSDIHQLQVALEGYYADQQKYPDQLIFNGQPLISADGQTIYLRSVPKDPTGDDPQLYVYNATPAGQAAGYDICAYELESVSDDRTPGKDESFCLTNRQ
jgi:type II secretion system protein G